MINKLSQVSTKNGDKGTSQNYTSENFVKSDILFHTLGTIDELSSFLGLTYHFYQKEIMKEIQRHLQTINSMIATNPEHVFYSRINKISQEDVDFIEQNEQEVLSKNPLEPSFYLPGSETSLSGAYLDVSRSICRRAERELVNFVLKYHRRDLEIAQRYINRLSDFLFVLARSEMQK